MARRASRSLLKKIENAYRKWSLGGKYTGGAKYVRQASRRGAGDSTIQGAIDKGLSRATRFAKKLRMPWKDL